MAINTNKHLCFRAGGVNYSLNMMSAADVTSAGYSARLGVYADGSAWYVPAAPASASNTGFYTLCFRKGGTVYRCLNVKPMLTFTFANDTAKNDYEQVVGYNKTLTKVSTSIALNTALDIYMSANAGSSWTKVATLSAGSLSVSPNYNMSNATGGNFGVRAVTQVQLTRITGTVQWSGAEVVAGASVTARVSLSASLPTGRIYVTGEWNSLLPPFHTEGTTDVLTPPLASGSATQQFVTSGLTCSMKLYYDPKTSGVSKKKLAEITWASLGAAAINRTDSLSFDAVASGGAAQTVVESKAVTASATSWSAEVPQAYW